ncbi:succinate dehydrogenase, hydrophobic membrane anchor protein [Rhodobacteraceae bacterium XHP0102]|nr:succinate dehydrogenase, hydrophobic membrane anchor protein [Rhodobacteraceae bacterium XHP0102]
MKFATDRKRVVGLGSAGSGTGHFWTMTVTSVALLALTPIFVFTFGPLLGQPYEAVIVALGHPLRALIMALMIIVGLHHFRLGIQTVIEDYTGGLTRKASLIAFSIISYGLMATGLFAIAKLAF